MYSGTHSPPRTHFFVVHWARPTCGAIHFNGFLSSSFGKRLRMLNLFDEANRFIKGIDRCNCFPFQRTEGPVSALVGNGDWFGFCSEADTANESGLHEKKTVFDTLFVRRHRCLLLSDRYVLMPSAPDAFNIPYVIDLINNFL